MTPDLSRRIAFACAKGAATPDQRQSLIDAAGPPEVRSSEDMGVEAQRLLFRLEHANLPGSEAFEPRP